MRLRKFKVLSYGFLVMLIFFVAVLWKHDVSKNVTLEDKTTLRQIYPKPPVDADTLNFEKQVALIQDFQKAIHQKINRGLPIDYNQSREPKDLLLHSTGLCYDFSRTIEKFLVLNNFQIRHVAIYQTDTNVGKLKSFIKPGALSHSLTEVKTKKGWLIVDSNYEWISLDSTSNPISFKQFCDKQTNGESIKWLMTLETIYLPFYEICPVFIYGLYSRHGGFYPPYNIVPDYNLRDLLIENLFSGT
jgi:hypothetical protein